MKKNILRYMRILTALTLLALAVPATVPAQNSKPAAKRGKPYLSQVDIDTTVMRALYVLNEASAHYSVNNAKQNVAVNRARAILDDLRSRAAGDPNARYAFMKIQEVEAQIYLEEEEMRDIAENKRVLTMNQIVLQYNAEVGKPRPDFATLRRLFRQMAEVDTRQANNIANSYNKRHRQISHEAQVSLEKALVANDLGLARRELEYCERNKFYLMINPSLLAKQRARLEKIQNAQSDLPKIKQELSAGEEEFNNFNLATSRTNLTLARNRITEARPYIPAQEGAALSARCDKLIKDLDAREDSLVRTAMSILNRNGPDAATKYLQEELQRKLNISPERASYIDKAIIARSPERAVDDKHKVKMVDVGDDANPNFAELMSLEEKARYRAQERADSLQRVRERANGVSINIYTLLEQNKTRDASRLFNKEKTFLSKTIDKSAYDMLAHSVAYGVNVSRSAGARNPDAARDVGIVSATPAQSQSELEKNRDKAQEVTRRLYALLEKNEVAEAYLRFQERKKPLQKYLDRDSYEMLEFTIVQSYNYVSKR